MSRTNIYYDSCKNIAIILSQDKNHRFIGYYFLLLVSNLSQQLIL